MAASRRGSSWPAQRHHEGGGVAQVGADIDRGDGDRGAAQLGIAHVTALQKLGEQMAQLLADPELALARPLLVALGRATTGHFFRPCVGGESGGP
jgi:hypothetical protein